MTTDEEVDMSSGHWVQYNDKFLGGYSDGENRFDNLQNAQTACLQHTGQHPALFSFPVESFKQAYVKVLLISKQILNN